MTAKLGEFDSPLPVAFKCKETVSICLITKTYLIAGPYDVENVTIFLSLDFVKRKLIWKDASSNAYWLDNDGAYMGVALYGV